MDKLLVLSAKMNRLLRYIYICAVINLVIYSVCAVLQWILFAKERAVEVSCLDDVVLAAAILTSLATLVKCISTFCSVYLDVNVAKKGYAAKAVTAMKVFQLLLKIAALGCTAYVATFRSKSDPCGTETDPGDHPELLPLISTVASLESISTTFEIIIKICEIVYRCRKRKMSRMQLQEDDREPLTEQMYT